MTFLITIGKFGGFYVSFRGEVRLCLGWIAFTVFPFDLETRLLEILRGKHRDL